jgi:glycosyltransferase involved in cell wall biosynthesis
MARIYIDARCVTDEPCGVGRYALELIPALTALAPAHEFVVIRHASNRTPIGAGPNTVETFVERLDGDIGHFLFGRGPLERVFNRHGTPDLYHSLFHLLPLGFPRRAAAGPAVVITLHDLIWLDHPLQLTSKIVGVGTWLYGSIALPRGIRRADRVISISNTTARRAERMGASTNVVTILHGIGRRYRADPPPLPARFRHLEEDERPYVIAVANAKKTKNLSLLVRAFALASRRGLRARLVLVGKCGALARGIAAAGIAGETLLPGFVSDDDLLALVGHAALLVHPALAEGFGRPPLEAMALGTPAAVSDIPVMREITGDAALTFDPRDPDALADILVRVIADPNLQSDMSRRGRAWAATFQWSRAAAATLAVYESVLADRASGTRAR